MKKLLINFIFICTLLMESAVLQAQAQSIQKEPLRDFKTLIISSDTIKQYDLTTKYIQILPDTVGKWTINEISSPSFSDKFISVDISGNITDTNLFKIGSEVYWYRFKVKNKLKYPKSWFISFYDEHELEQLYIPDSIGNFIVKKTGNNLALKDRDFKYTKNTFFDVTIGSGQEQLFYVRICNGHKTYIEPYQGYLISKNDLLGEKFLNRFINALFLGIFLIMVLYNLILFFAIKEKSYVYYVLYIFSFALFFFNENGYAFEFLWPKYPLWSGFLILFLSFWHYSFTFSLVKHTFRLKKIYQNGTEQ
jgi:hypothetical protein